MRSSSNAAAEQFVLWCSVFPRPEAYALRRPLANLAVGPERTAGGTGPRPAQRPRADPAPAAQPRRRHCRSCRALVILGAARAVRQWQVAIV